MNYSDEILTLVVSSKALSISFPPEKKQRVYVYKSEKYLKIIRQIQK